MGRLGGSYKLSTQWRRIVDSGGSSLIRRITHLVGVVSVKQGKLILKIAVVLSSVVLVSGFVAYRAGAFSRLIGPTIMSSSKSRQVFDASLSDSAQPPYSSLTPAD